MAKKAKKAKKRLKQVNDANTAFRRVEFPDAVDSLNVLDDNGEPACKVTRLPNGGLLFRFRDGTQFKGLSVVVPLGEG